MFVSYPRGDLHSCSPAIHKSRLLLSNPIALHERFDKTYKACRAPVQLVVARQFQIALHGSLGPIASSAYHEHFRRCGRSIKILPSSRDHLFDPNDPYRPIIINTDTIKSQDRSGLSLLSSFKGIVQHGASTNIREIWCSWEG